MVLVSHPLTRPGALGALVRSGVTLSAMRALYRGAPIKTGAVTSAVCLGSFDVVRRGIERNQGGERASPFEVAEAGLAAGALSALLGDSRKLASVSRTAISTGLFFGLSNFTRTRFFSQENATSVPALLAGGAVGGVVSEAARLVMEGAASAAKSPRSGPVVTAGLARQVMRSLPGTFSFVLTASAIQKSMDV